MTKPLSALLGKLSPAVVEEARRGVERQRPIIEALIALQELQQQLGLSQVELAEALGIQQSAVSRLLRRKDMKASTLQGLIAAMGGRLRLVAEFPTGRYEIAPFATNDDEGEVPTTAVKASPVPPRAEFASAEPGAPDRHPGLGGSPRPGACAEGEKPPYSWDSGRS